MNESRREHGHDRAPDPRPRPQYGEYATPAEQRARIQHPSPPTSAPPVAPVLPGSPAAPPTQTVRPGAMVNRIVTVVLLAFGALNVAMGVFALLDLPVFMNAEYKMMGVSGTFAATPAAQMWGNIAAVVLAVGYLLTLAISLLVLRRGRVSWWIPIVGAVITGFAVAFILLTPLMADPAYVHYLSTLTHSSS